jgi:hypothetical protein
VHYWGECDDPWYRRVFTAAGKHRCIVVENVNTPVETYIDNVNKATAWLPGNLFRPPYGRIRFSQANKLRKMGFKIVMWSLLSCDYDPNLDREQSLKKLIKYSANGSIVVFHDSEKAYENLKFLLPRYLEFLTRHGFEMKILE